jgi:glycolate oxidase FAD binding subunit
MSVAATRTERPASYEQAAALLAECSNAGARVRVRGGGTKLGWGNAVPEPEVELSTAALDEIVEHNAGDLTAILQAGVPLARAQERFARAGQMLAIDPPGEAATIGGIVATADSGPLRHRYGAPRDLVLGVTVALAGGEIARAGGKVIKNVAGYDLAKLFTGSFGTLGAIVEVAVRLHPLPVSTATLVVTSRDPRELSATAARLAHAPLELQALDVAWGAGEGRVLARFAGQTAADQAAAAGGGEVVEDDTELWERQRRSQRGATVVRVSGVQAELPRAIAVTERHGGALAGRAALSVWWISLPDGDVEGVRRELAPLPCVVLDAPRELRAALDPWGDPGPAALMRRVKARFDPAGTLNPGVFAGGI